MTYKNYSSFDGTTIKKEPSTIYEHQRTGTGGSGGLGSYKNSPFVTGSRLGNKELGIEPGYEMGLKTEILDYDNGAWMDMGESQDYPFSSGDRYVKLLF